LTAVAAKVLGAKGGYRCPGENGFVYVVYSTIAFVGRDDVGAAMGAKPVERREHGKGFAAYACEHLISNPAQEWFSRDVG
jgi:hypothetical protein